MGSLRQGDFQGLPSVRAAITFTAQAAQTPYTVQAAQTQNKSLYKTSSSYPNNCGPDKHPVKANSWQREVLSITGLPPAYRHTSAWRK